jgi:hypothetical protein
METAHPFIRGTASYNYLANIFLRTMLFRLTMLRSERKSKWGVQRGFRGKSLACLVLAAAGFARAQTCQMGEDLESSTSAALEATARRYFALAAKGDAASLRQSAIPSVAEAFSGIATAVQDNQANFAKAQPVLRAAFQLTADGQASLERAEFLCGVFGKSGQTASSAVFLLNNLPPGRYAVVILDVNSGEVKNADVKSGDGTSNAVKSGGATTDVTPYAVSFVLQRVGGDWKLGGFYAKPVQCAGHNSAWFADRARAFAAKGETHNAWFYFLEARDLATAVPFMSTQETDRLYDQSQKATPPDSPGAPLELAGAGKTYKIKTLFAYGVADEVNLVVKYDCADVSDAAKTYADNQAVAKALVAKWPELRDAFGAIVARATEASGKDYGTLVAMKDLK